MMKETAELLRTENKVILVHSNADMDAIGSAFAISVCFPNGDVFAPGGVDRVASLVAEKLGISVLEECDISSYGTVVVVDTSSPEQLRPAVESIPEGSIVIDHHKPTGKWEGVHFFCDDKRVSCCEIVKDIIESAGIDIPRNAAMALLGGMITDSGHFQHANPALMRAFADLLQKNDIHIDEIFGLTRSQMVMSERIAVMKAVGRAKFDSVGDMIVATSYGGSFEASSCRALIAAGADVVFVGSQRDEEFRISSRATQEIVRRGIHLGNIVGGISGETDTDGGGHGGAAGISGEGDIEAMLHICMKRTMDEFRAIKKAQSDQDII
ncbi:manganese-dependent inorganic pyrophosphatase [Candidatus Methanoplasma termitum]|uniref:PpaC protein n=1 Tax=Candidatus Methanoplasma termitum TaxID=1577791 RepID=A0A0A7LCP1_9ARCH|nr:DHH family phosphoesterase [Candidatus Methanoplasma termitum]AIZ56940.1 manganese-dependent inorganic pyrophosphatase [Candidatus Methanoplasma termitum]MCL2333532.1 DHH family phosphoesterase [Candidatus Methanoplasma sp.]